MNQKTKTSNEQKTYNFGAGPACLPEQVLTQIREDIPDWYDGMSIMEISHRLPAFMDLAQTIEADLRHLLRIPDDFAVLFMHGGARSQFSAVPLNLLDQAQTADYLDTGVWSEMAFNEAKKYCKPNEVASAKSNGYTRIPDEKEWSYSEKGLYFHYTDNETIQGLEFHTAPKRQNKWLIADMTSNILTKPIDFNQYGLIYASAQKNLGIAGITVVIVRKELLGKAHPMTPSMLDYSIYHQSQSLFNTPPMFCWYVLGLMVKWTQTLGDCEALKRLCEQKSSLIYDVIDSSDFYHNPVNKQHRSRINIPFRLPNETLESQFIQQAHSLGLKQLKGHKIVGGIRASVYNAMPMQGVNALVNFMQDFQKKHG